MPPPSSALLGPLLAFALLFAMYLPVLLGLGAEWLKDDTVSYGIVVAPLALYFAWRQRVAVAAERVSVEAGGLCLTFCGCLLYVIGRICAGNFILRFSLIVVLTGIVLTFWGGKRLRALAFPLLVLATMIPLPAVISNSLTLHLQLFVSQLSGYLLAFLSVPVYQEGNVLQLKGIAIGVAEACSGLRSLYSLLITALPVALFSCRTWASRVACLASAIPTAIAINILRITATALIATHRPDLAVEFFHTFSALLMFALECALLMLAARAFHYALD